MTWFTFIVLTLVVWRVTRFLIADELISGTRDQVVDFLERKSGGNGRKARWADKVLTLIGCPWCVSIYVAAATLVAARIFVVDSIPMPAFTWLAIAAAAILPYNYVDGE